MTAPNVKAVPARVLNADPRLFSDDHLPELVRELMRALLREQRLSQERWESS